MTDQQPQSFPPKRAAARPQSFQPEQTREPIEELSFAGSARPSRVPYSSLDDFDAGNSGNPNNPRRSRLWLRVLVGVIVAALLISGGGATWWMWDTRWRPIDVTVDSGTGGENVRTHIGATMDVLLENNGSFGRKPGRLLAIDGSVIDETGGKPVSVTINGREIPVGERSQITVPEHADVTVADGADVTESHTVRHDAVEYSTDNVDLTGIIQRFKQAGKNGTREVWVGAKSGVEVDKGVIEQSVDLVVESFNPRPAGRKVVALTFDDGPSQYSDKVLDVLKEKKAKATFFDLGEQALAWPAVEKRMAAEGHQVASHSNTHPNMPDLSESAMRADIEDSFANIKTASGVSTTVFRSPYGAFGVKQWAAAGDLIGMNVLWDIDTEDWKLPGADAIHDAVLDNAHNGAIVLMHDGGGDRSQTVEALPKIIDDLRKAGYEFVTIDQLIQLSGR